MADRRSIIRWDTNSGPTTFRTSLRVKSEQLQERIANVVANAAEIAEQTMHEVIETSGTGWVGSGPFASPTNRMDYGEMDAAVKHRVHRYSTVARAEWGWIDEQRPYYFYQDQGFWHTHYYGQPKTPKWVEGMHATFTAAMAAKEYLDGEFSRMGLKRRNTRIEVSDV